MSKLKEALSRLSKDYKEEIEKQIIAKEMVASGKLKNSLRVRLEDNGFSISSDELHSYLLGSEGYRAKTTGSKSDRVEKWDRLGEWARSKGMQPLIRDKKGRFRKVNKNSYRSLGYLISRSINRKGTIQRFGYKGSEVISSAVESLNQKSKDVLVEAFEQDIIAMVREDFKYENLKIE